MRYENRFLDNDRLEPRNLDRAASRSDGQHDHRIDGFSGEHTFDCRVRSIASRQAGFQNLRKGLDAQQNGYWLAQAHQVAGSKPFRPTLTKMCIRRRAWSGDVKP